ncbi:MAG: hypothetical protein J6C98_02180 [Oscillospiraceae bacterium]|nr:hypothetical protein [Oscillospiraceae bacterium]
MKNRRFAASILWIVVGIGLMIWCWLGSADEYWNGMGTALVVVGILQLVRHIRYRTDEAYRENVDVEAGDERNKYIAMKAWSWAGYLYVMIAAVASVVLKIAGFEELVPLTAGSVCLIMVIYWLSYLFLRKKY